MGMGGASSSARHRAARGRKGRGKEKEERRKKKEKEKKKKGRGGKRNKIEGGVGAIRGSGRQRACCGVRPVSDGRERLRWEATLTQNEGKGKGI